MYKACILLFQGTYQLWKSNRVPKMGAALSFYTVFSLAPLAVIVLSLLSLAVERGAARAEIVGQFRSFVGEEGAEVMAIILTKTGAESHDILGTVLGFVVLLVGASAVFGELQDSMNQIWNVSSKRHPLFILLKERAFSFAMVFVMGFLMLISFMLSAALAAAGKFLQGRHPALDGAWEWGNAVVSLLVIALLFALIFRLIPDTRIAWGDVWLGASISAGLFVLGKFVLGFYFGRSVLASSYGAAGSLIIILVWVFYSAQILYFGAAFTRIYATQFGSRREDETVEMTA